MGHFDVEITCLMPFNWRRPQPHSYHRISFLQRIDRTKFNRLVFCWFSSRTQFTDSVARSEAATEVYLSIHSKRETQACTETRHMSVGGIFKDNFSNERCCVLTFYVNELSETASHSTCDRQPEGEKKGSQRQMAHGSAENVHLITEPFNHSLDVIRFDLVCTVFWVTRKICHSQNETNSNWRCSMLLHPAWIINQLDVLRLYERSVEKKTPPDFSCCACALSKFFCNENLQCRFDGAKKKFDASEEWHRK